MTALFHRNSLGTLGLLLVIAAPWAFGAGNGPAADPTGSQAASHWVLVLHDPRPPRRRGWASGVGYSGPRHYDSDPALDRLVRRVLKPHALEALETWPIASLNVHCVTVALSAAKRQTVLTALRTDKRVAWIQPLNEFATRGGSAPDQDGSGDPYRTLQRSLHSLNVAPVHPVVNGQGVRVGVIDSGIERDHPDLRRRGDGSARCGRR